jgi:hypothetical protein
MFNFEKIDLTFSFNPIFFFAALILLAAYAAYVYRYTVPQVSPAKKFFFVSLRTLALLLLLFIIFEPILTLARNTILEPRNLIFIDNSRSIKIEDGTEREENIEDFIRDLNSSGALKNSDLFSFGISPFPIDEDSLNQLDYSEGGTNFSKIFSEINKENKNISSLVVISDGVITDGANPLYAAEKMNIPVYTIGVGDSIRRNDIEIKNVIYNEFIYAESPTTILTSISNTGFSGRTITLSLFENDRLIEQKNIQLSDDGIQNHNFTYTPGSTGEKKLTLAAASLDGEFTFANNRRVFFVNVLSNKIKVVLVAGAPSADVSYLKNTLLSDDNISLNTITQFAPGKFLEQNNRDVLIDSADILYLAGFPSAETPEELLRKIVNAIIEKNKSYFLLLSANTDFNKLNSFRNELSFTFSRSSQSYNEVQPHITSDQQRNPLLQNNAQNPLDTWNNLPPVFQPSGEFKAKPESDVIAKIKMNNVPLNSPLILSRKIGSRRSITVLAKDIWKWKLQSAVRELDLYDRFILNSVKWLNTAEDQKKVSIKTSKKLYSLGEPVEFSAQVYDDAFNPVFDAEVKINVNQNGERYEINLSALGSGLYEGTFQPGNSGDYSFSGTAILDENNLGSDGGKFNIGEIDIEMINPRMDFEFLSQLANYTNGRFFYQRDYSELFDILKDRSSRSSKTQLEVSEISLWSNEWLMIIIILLFALEWFFRKRAGMI